MPDAELALAVRFPLAEALEQEPDQVLAEAKAWAAVLTEGAPLAQRATKEVAWRTADMGWIESVRFGEVMRKVAGATEDVAEGLQACRDKRRPDWRGR